MKHHLTPLLLLALCATQPALCAPSSLKYHVTYEVTLPTSADPVAYDIDIISRDAPDDPYAESYYLIDWTLRRPGGDTRGFSAYLPGGHHYRYKDGTPMQEYHASADPAPFLTDDGGVARRAQFYDLLPAAVRAKIDQIKTDSTFVWQRTDLPDHTTRIDGTQRVRGYDALEFTYLLRGDNATTDDGGGETTLPLPDSFEITYNPAAISEQTVTVHYRFDTPTPSYTDGDDLFTEDWLAARHPRAFEAYRQDNFRAEALRGQPAPTFTYTAPGVGRVSHNRGDTTPSAPLVVAFLDADVADVAATAGALRAATQAAGRPVTLVFAFKDDRPAGVALDTDSVALSPGRLIRDCGITVYPTVMVIDSTGTIADILPAFGRDDADTLTQAVVLLP